MLCSRTLTSLCMLQLDVPPVLLPGLGLGLLLLLPLLMMPLVLPQRKRKMLRMMMRTTPPIMSLFDLHVSVLALFLPFWCSDAKGGEESRVIGLRVLGGCWHCTSQIATSLASSLA